MRLLWKIAKDQWFGYPGHPSLSTSAGVSLHRSGLDPRVKPEDDEAVGGFAQSPTLVVGGGGHTNASSFWGKGRSRATRESTPERR